MTSTRPCVERVQPSEAAEWLFGVLQKEPEDVLGNLDGGGFGRPLTLAGIQKWLDPFETASGNYDRCNSFLSYKNTQPAAHCAVRVARIHSYNDGGKLGYLAVVYTAQDFRNRGMGSAAVRAATQYALASLEVEEVAFLLANRNKTAQAFYHGLGFHPTEQRFVKAGIAMTLWTVSREEFAAACHTA